MIANVSPAANQYEETVNSLKYANRAKDIKTKVQQNVIETEMHVVQYQSIIAALRQEVMDLKSQLAVGAGPVKLPAIPRPSPRTGSSKNLLGGGGSPDEVRSNSRNEAEPDGGHLEQQRQGWTGGGAGNVVVKPAVAQRQNSLGQHTAEAEKLADKAKGIFKERAKYLKKLIAIEEATYSLKIDLAVRNVEQKRIEEDPMSRPEELQQAGLGERELHEQIREKVKSSSKLGPKP